LETGKTDASRIYGSTKAVTTAVVRALLYVTCVTSETFITLTDAIVTFTVVVTVVLTCTNRAIRSNECYFAVRACLTITGTSGCITCTMRRAIIWTFSMLTSITKMFVSIMANAFTCLTVANSIVGA
jgi:hypothetical protein